MKILTTTLCFLMIFTSFAQSLKIDTEKTKVSYDFVKEKVSGTVEGFDATITLNLDDISQSVIKGSVDATTLTSGNKMRDKHLQAKGYFNTKEFPQMTFVSDSFEKTNEGYKVIGKMTIKDIAQDVTIDFVYSEHMITGKCMIYTNDFKLAKKKNRDDSKVVIKFEIVVQ